MIKRAIDNHLISTQAINIRDFASGKHHITDDTPYGGGSGMIMKPEPIIKAIRFVKSNHINSKVFLLSPQGCVFDQTLTKQLAGYDSITLICGRYEGIDDRVSDLIDAEISIGDYVLTGGELAAMVLIDAIIRHIPGVLGGEDAAEKDSFENGLLEYAHYTRPPVFENESVPEVLRSGHHQAIDQWRRESSLMRTLFKRPDLLMTTPLKNEDISTLIKWKKQIDSIIQTNTLPCPNSLSSD